jgi:RNA polymerase sigma-70 factor (ECF subfamily)
MAHDRERERAFDGFVREVEPRLRRALVAAYGPQAGRDATVDALGWAWANWDRVEALENPAGYLYRVGQTKAREDRRPLHVVPPDRAVAERSTPWVEPNLEPALLALSEQQRVAVVLCHGFQWTHREVAELLDLSPSTVQNHVERGLANLRRALEVTNDV